MVDRTADVDLSLRSELDCVTHEVDENLPDTESITNHEGKVTFTGENSFTLHPEHGTYKGNVGSKIIDRPMTDAERTPVKCGGSWSRPPRRSAPAPSPPRR